MPLSRLFVLIIPAAMMVLGVSVASGQTYPNKPIRMITSVAGGGNDFAARLVAQGISPSMGQQVIVDNRGGTVMAELVAKAPADGYTLLFGGTDIWVNPLLQTVPYDVVRDFAPISMVMSSPNVVVVHPSLLVRSVQELIAMAKAKPGSLNYGSAATGTSTHLAAELFKAMAGVDIVRIGYKGGGPALTAVIAGEVPLYFAVAGSTLTPHIQSGRLRALAVTSALPSALAPGLPTVAASGLPGYENVAYQSVFAPAKSPEVIVNRLHQEIVRYVSLPETRERLLNAGVEAFEAPLSSLPTL